MSKKSKIAMKSTMYMLVCAAIGFFVSYYGMMGIGSQLKLESLSMGWYSYDIVTILLLLSVVALLAASLIDYSRTKGIEDEERREIVFGRVLMYNTFSLFVSLMAFFLGALQYMKGKGDSAALLATVVAAGILLVAPMLAQIVFIRAFNKRYPKRSINMYSKDDDGKPYIDKLDEAERYIVFKSSYRAFSAQNFALYVLTCVAFAYCAIVEFQIFPFLILLTLFIVNNISYMLEANKHC